MADGSKRGVNIPVEVTGAEQAQAELRDTKAAVEGVGTGGAKAAGGAAQLGDAAGKATAGAKGLGDAAGKTNPALDETKKKGEGAAKSLVDFDNKGERAAKTLLGLFNPQLSQAADALLDVLGGLTKINPMLLAISLGAAGIATLVNLLQGARKAAEELNEQLERQARIVAGQERGAAALQARVADDLAKAGVFDAGLAERATRRTIELNRQGVRAQLAQDAAVAGAIAAAGGQAFDEDAFLAGVIARGKTSADFGDNNAKAMQEIQAAQAAGGTPQARAALQQYIRATAPAAVQELIQEDPTAVGSGSEVVFDAAEEETKRRRQLSDRDSRRARRVADAFAGRSGESPGRALELEGLNPENPTAFEPDNWFSPWRRIEPGERDRILGAARDILGLAGSATSRTDGAASSQPVIINNSTTNIGTVLQSSDRLGDYTFNPALDRESFRR
ncbi:MAG: hypothetical protein SF069_02960 [Phycisphaerae bacterium]|nr:hypothetical protein [Phycisphaerae bacterium]